MPFLALDPALAEPAVVTTLGAPIQGVGMSLAEFRGRLNLQLGGRPDITPPMLDQWINAAYIDVCSSLELNELSGSLALDLINSQSLYMLPAVVRAIKMVSVIDSDTYGELGGRSLTMTDLKAFRKAPDRVDEPTEYFRSGDILVVYPSPVSVRTLSLDIWIRPQKLLLDTDCPVLHEEWHEPILRNARTMAHSDLREFDKAAVTSNDYVEMVRRKESTEVLEEGDKIIGSSVPHHRRQLFRRHLPFDREGDWDGIR